MSAPATSSPDRHGPRSSLDWAREARLGPELARTIRAAVARRRRRRIAAAAMACLLVVTTFSLWQSGETKLAVPVIAANGPSATVISPERRVLEDGSVVEFKPGAEIQVDYSPERRHVALLRGEAHFLVAKNPQWPFVVTVHGVKVRAVGTAFSVGLGAGAVEVLVTEGVVALTTSDTPRTADVASGDRMTAGNRATIDLTVPAVPAVQAMTAAQMAERLSWRVPRLQFSGTPLTEVVELFRTVGGVNVVLADPALGRVRVSGVLRANNSEALLRLLAADHDIVSEQRADRVILRRAR